MVPFDYIRGAVHLPAAGLWLDAHHRIGAEETVFVSHAHSDHTGAHARVLFSAPTQRLMRARIGGERQEQVLEFGRRYEGAVLGLRDPVRALTLLPAGHILGSAMSLVETDAGSLLYTGDFKLRPGLSAEVCESRPADVLVMETTFGRPKYVFPPTAEILEAVVKFCRDSIERDEVPVLLGYSLGKSQEVLAALGAAGLPAMLNESVAKLTRVYEALGQTFGKCAAWDPDAARGHVVLAPPGAGLPALRQRLGRSRVAVLTGWAVDSSCRYQYRADAAFPLSDHADFADLVALVRQVGPKKVFTLHGFAAEFASHLRSLGYDAAALGEQEQLELRL